MSSVNLSLAVVFLLAACTVIHSFKLNLPTKPKPGFVQPWIPSLDDIRMCKEIENGRKLRLVMRIPLETCKPMCVYENETQQIQAIDGQLCCDIVGVAPTGMCKDGVCMVGGLVGLDENGVKHIFNDVEN